MTRARFAIVAALLVAVTGCEAMDTGGGIGRRKSASPGASDDDAGEPVSSSPPVGGAGSAGGPGGVVTVPPVEGGPGGEQPAQPGGYKEAVAPLLAAAGCMECHHAGRAIDLSRYPFMAGDKAQTADQLARSLESTMPPSPRTKVDATVVARVQKWRQDGMKP